LLRDVEHRLPPFASAPRCCPPRFRPLYHAFRYSPPRMMLMIALLFHSGAAAAGAMRQGRRRRAGRCRHRAPLRRWRRLRSTLYRRFSLSMPPPVYCRYAHVIADIRLPTISLRQRFGTMPRATIRETRQMPRCAQGLVITIYRLAAFFLPTSRGKDGASWRHASSALPDAEFSPAIYAAAAADAKT